MFHAPWESQTSFTRRAAKPETEGSEATVEDRTLLLPAQSRLSRA
jgi:hypothetical protein